MEKAGPICFGAGGIQVVIGEVQDLKRSPRHSRPLCTLYNQPHHLGFGEFVNRNRLCLLRGIEHRSCGKEGIGPN